MMQIPSMQLSLAVAIAAATVVVAAVAIAFASAITAAIAVTIATASAETTQFSGALQKIPGYVILRSQTPLSYLSQNKTVQGDVTMKHSENPISK
jgi:hypothetical protein